MTPDQILPRNQSKLPQWISFEEPNISLLIIINKVERIYKSLRAVDKMQNGLLLIPKLEIELNGETKIPNKL